MGIIQSLSWIAPMNLKPSYTSTQIWFLSDILPILMAECTSNRRKLTPLLNDKKYE